LKKEELKNAFEQLKPNEKEVDRMLNKILRKDETPKKEPSGAWNRIKKPVLAFVLVLAVGIGIFAVTRPGGSIHDPGEREQMDIDLSSRQFQFKSRYYTLLTEDKRSEYGFADTVFDDQIGKKIGTIEEGDEPFIGKDFFEYLPAKGEAVVVVKTDEGNRLFEFYAFRRYLDNQDEDTATYLSLYGIKSPDDIAKIQFFAKDQKKEGSVKVTAELTDSTDIRTFYNNYSILKDSSKEYFDLVQGKGNIAGNTPTLPNLGQSVIPSVSPGQSGASLLENTVLIRIVTKTGLYMEMPYYPSIGFISRHKVSEPFKEFLDNFIE
jgi:hypothetical protein